MREHISVNWEQHLTPDYIRLSTRILRFYCKKNQFVISSRSVVGMPFLYQLICLLRQILHNEDSLGRNQEISPLTATEILPR